MKMNKWRFYSRISSNMLLFCKGYNHTCQHQPYLRLPSCQVALPLNASVNYNVILVSGCCSKTTKQSEWTYTNGLKSAAVHESVHVSH